MIRTWMAPWLLVAVPILGAGLSWLWRASLPRMKTAALVTAAVSFCSVIGSALALGEPSTAVPFLCLLPLTAYLSLLGQPLHRETSPAWPMSLIVLGLGLGTLTSQGPAHGLLRLLLRARIGWICALLATKGLPTVKKACRSWAKASRSASTTRLARVKAL